MKNLLHKPKINKNDIGIFISIIVLIVSLGYIVLNYGEGLLFTMKNYNVVMAKKRAVEARMDKVISDSINMDAQDMTEANLSK